MYIIRKTKKFKKSLKQYRKSGNFNVVEIQKVVNILLSGKKLDLKYRDHQLKGGMKDYRECHIKPDLLLIY